MTRDLAICYDKLGEAKHAHKEYRAAYALCQKHLGLLSTETIDVAQHFADFCIQGAKRARKSASATETLREARALMQRLLDDLQKDNPNPDFLVDGDGRDVDTCYQQDIFDAANTLGLLCDTLNDETEAERNYKLAREGNARLHGCVRVHVCMCACLSLSLSLSLSVCVCVCVRERERESVCVCVCVCE